MYKNIKRYKIYFNVYVITFQEIIEYTDFFFVKITIQNLSNDTCNEGFDTQDKHQSYFLNIQGKKCYKNFSIDSLLTDYLLQLNIKFNRAFTANIIKNEALYDCYAEFLLLLLCFVTYDIILFLLIFFLHIARVMFND